MMNPSKPKRNLCVVRPTFGAVTETFIDAHVEHLSANITVARGLPPRVDARPDHGDSTSFRIRRGLWNRVRSDGPFQQHTLAYLQTFRRARADAVLAEYGMAGVYAMRACRELRIPLIVHFHGFDASRTDILKHYGDAYRQMFSQASALVAVSRSMQQKLVSLGARPDLVVYSPYGVDCSKFDKAEPADAPARFLAVGRLVDKKAPHLLILAFARVHRHNSEARLDIIGDGPLMRVCRDLVKELGIEDRVTFHGDQPHEVVQRAMRDGKRAFVQHSVIADSGDSEGTPLAILEAGASGLPVVSTRHAGIQDVVVHGETGFLVEEGDVPGMAEYMIRLLQNPDLAAALGQSARRFISNNFDLERSIHRLESVIEACIVGAQLPVSFETFDPTGFSAEYHNAC